MSRYLRIVLTVWVIGLAGCSTTVSGSPKPSGSPGDIVGVGRDIAKVLPDDADFVGALGAALDDDGFPPFVDGLDVLPDGIREAATHPKSIVWV